MSMTTILDPRPSRRHAESARRYADFVKTHGDNGYVCVLSPAPEMTSGANRRA
jgi:hypothetical protein